MKQESICDCLTTSILTRMKHNLLKELLQNWRVKPKLREDLRTKFFLSGYFFFSGVNWDGEAEAEAWPGPCSVGAATVNDAFTAKAGEFTLQLVLFVEAQNRSSASGFGFPALTDVNLLHWQRVSSWSRWIAGVFSAFSVRETNQPSERPHVLLYLPAFVMSLRELRPLRN